MILVQWEENTATITTSISFEEWCEGTVTDGVCDEYGNTYELSDFESDCTEEGGHTQMARATCQAQLIGATLNHTFTLLLQ